MSGSPPHRDEISHQSPGGDPPAVPLSIQVDVLDRMLNFEIADDPIYQGLEIQGFDDPDHGRGLTVFLSRRDNNQTDVYYETDLRLDPSTYEIGGGLGAWVETRFDAAQFLVEPARVAADVRFFDADGRRIEVAIDHRTHRPGRKAAFLAPMGAAITEPRSLPLVWMSRFDLLGRGGPPPRITIDGRNATPGRLPGEALLRRRLIKVASDLFIVSINPARVRHAAADPHVAVSPGGHGIEELSAGLNGHEARLHFDPPFPDLAEGGDCAGDWHLEIDGSRVIAGSWFVAQRGAASDIGLDVTEGWRPRGLPWLMRIVTSVVPVFRHWPTTYMWRARYDIETRSPITAGWTRTGTDRGDSYRALTRS